MEDKHTVNMRNVNEAIKKRMNHLLDERLSKLEQTVVHGVVFFVLAGKLTQTQREQMVGLAQARAASIYEELDRQAKEEELLATALEGIEDDLEEEADDESSEVQGLS